MHGFASAGLQAINGETIAAKIDVRYVLYPSPINSRPIRNLRISLVPAPIS